MKSLKPVVALIASLFVASAALAHSDEYLDTQKSPNGGQTRMASIYHFELVVAKDSKEAKDNPVVVHVTDHAWAKISTAGAVGTATILAGKTKVSVKLVPAGENLMQGVGKYASTPDMKVVVSITLVGKSPEQARFTPLAPVAAAATAAPAKDGHMDHKH
ncbi:MAG: hypothetical protein IPN05_01535 [Sulfuritalea sp.]|jgi:hypothetical protein|nr:hypothetical protein [Sulfuritalea sp.]